MSLPFTDPVLIFAFAMLMFLVSPILFERLRVPGIVGLIVAGAVIGPNALHLLDRSPTMVLLGTVGLLYLMFMIGLELDLNDFSRYRNRSLVFGTVSFAVPQAIGTGIGLASGYSLASSLLLGAVFSSHTVLAYPIASRLGIVKNLAVTTALGGTILTEILALSMLAVVAGMEAGDTGIGLWANLLVSLGIYIGLVMWGVPIVARWFFRNVRSEPTLEFAFVMVVLFGVAYLAHAANAEPIIGALLAGLALNRLVPESSPLMNRIQFVGNAIFIPFFLLSVGMLVDARSLSEPSAFTFAALLAFGVAGAKWLAAWVTQKIFGYTPAEGRVIFGLTVAHASGTLAIVLVGFDIGLFDQPEINGAILIILVTCLIGPWVVQRSGRQVALAEENRPYEPREAPQRILIPVSNPATEESLLDLAMILRDPGPEPIHALMVVPDLDESTEAQVAEAERTLSHAVAYGAGADVPVLPVTRVDQNIAAGIARGIAETRSSVVVVGWKAGRTTATREIFGTVLDQLTFQTKQMVIVAKLGAALNTTRRVVVVLPPLIHRHPGFFAAARTTKVLANRLGASLLGLSLDSDANRMADLYKPIKPSANATFEKLPGWSSTLTELARQVGPDDLVVLMSARPNSLPWHPRLERLPAHLARIVPRSFLIIYPPEVDTGLSESAMLEDLPRGLLTERIVRDLPDVRFDEALRMILEHGLPVEPQRLDAIVATLVAGEMDFSTELKPGVVVPHARISGLDQPLIFLGTSREGITFPNSPDPARLIFILLSPAEEAQAHLSALAEIARFVARDDQVATLLDEGPMDEAAVSTF